MFVSRSIGLFILLNFNVICQERRLSLKFAYPEDEEEDPHKPNAQLKAPVYIQDLCKSGEIFYPGDKLDDWTCDCKPAYLYHPATDQCYPACTRGPCESGESLNLPPNSGVPKCRPKPCAKDNFVQFRDDCHALNKPGPCMLPELGNVVGVNETTLEIVCTKDYQIALGLGPHVVNGEGGVVNHTNQTTTTRPSPTPTPTPPSLPDDDDDDDYSNAFIFSVDTTTTTTTTTTKAPIEPPTSLPHDAISFNKPLVPRPPTRPPMILHDPSPTVNNTKYFESRCFIGGRRWVQKKCPGQNQ